MDLSPYVDSLRQDLATAASVGDEQVRETALRMSQALEPALRMTLIQALGQAAAEVSAELPAGSVEVRLRGRDPELVVDVPDHEHTMPLAPQPPAPPEPPEPEDAATARITLRLPEHLKERAEELAGEAGHSLNTWIVNAVRAATRSSAVTIDLDLSSMLADGERPHRTRGGPRRMTGWV